MDILLTQSYLIERDPPQKKIMRPYPPLGIMYLTSFLLKNGFDVHILDNTFELSLAEFTRLIKSEKPELVGISSVEISRNTAIEMCGIAKRAGCRIVVGGPDPVNYREAYFNAGADFICSGEGEQTLTDLMRYIKYNNPSSLDQISGLYYRNDSEEIYTGNRDLNSNINSFSFPTWDLVPVDKYLDAWKKTHSETALSVISSRGCPYGCTWCSKNVFGKSFRRRTPSDFLDEIIYLNAEYKPDYIWFADDSFTSSLVWLTQFETEYSSMGEKLPYECLGRVDEITPEIAAILRATDCRLIWFGAESGSQRVLDAMNKGFTVEEILYAGKIMAEYKIPVGFFIMLGYPPEDREDVMKTVNLVRKLKPDRIGVSIAYPIAGTEFHDQVVSGKLDACWTSSGENRPVFKTRYNPNFYKFARRLILKEAQSGLMENGPSFVDRAKLNVYRAGMRMFS